MYFKINAFVDLLVILYQMGVWGVLGVVYVFWMMWGTWGMLFCGKQMYIVHVNSLVTTAGT